MTVRDLRSHPMAVLDRQRERITPAEPNRGWLGVHRDARTIPRVRMVIGTLSEKFGRWSRRWRDDALALGPQRSNQRDVSPMNSDQYETSTPSVTACAASVRGRSNRTAAS
jgi:hypothetical protein